MILLFTSYHDTGEIAHFIFPLTKKGQIHQGQADNVRMFSFGTGTRAVAIHDSLNRESIQNPNFQVNHESTIRQNERILLLKESIHESRTDSKSRFPGES